MSAYILDGGQPVALHGKHNISSSFDQPLPEPQIVPEVAASATTGSSLPRQPPSNSPRSYSPQPQIVPEVLASTTPGPPLLRQPPSNSPLSHSLVERLRSPSTRSLTLGERLRSPSNLTIAEWRPHSTGGTPRWCDSATLDRVQRQIETLEAKVSRDDRQVDTALRNLEERVSSSESAVPRFGHRLAELSGQLKGLVSELQSQVRETDALHARLLDFRQGLDDDLQRHVSSLENRLEAAASHNAEVLQDLGQRLQRAELLLEQRLPAADVGGSTNSSNKDTLCSTVEALSSHLSAEQLKVLVEEMQSQILQIADVDTRLSDWRQDICDSMQQSVASLDHRLESVASAGRDAASRSEEVLQTLGDRLQRAESRLEEQHLSMSMSETADASSKDLAGSIAGTCSNLQASVNQLTDRVEELQLQVLGTDTVGQLSDIRNELQQNISQNSDRLRTLVASSGQAAASRNNEALMRLEERLQQTESTLREDLLPKAASSSADACSRLHARFDQLKAHHEELQLQVARVSDNLDTRTDNLDARLSEGQHSLQNMSSFATSAPRIDAVLLNISQRLQLTEARLEEQCLSSTLPRKLNSPDSTHDAIPALQTAVDQLRERLDELHYRAERPGALSTTLSDLRREVDNDMRRSASSFQHQVSGMISDGHNATSRSEAVLPKFERRLQHTEETLDVRLAEFRNVVENDCRGKIASLEHQLRDMVSDVQDANSLSKKVSTDFEDYMQRAESLEQDRLGGKISALEHQLRDMVSDVQDATSLSKKVSTDFEDYMHRAESLEQYRLGDKISSLEHQLRDMVSDVQDATSLSKKVSTDFEDYMQHAESLEQDRLGGKISSLEHQLRDMVSDVQDATSISKKVSTDFEDFVQHAESLEQDRLGGKISSLEHQLRDMVSDVQDASSLSKKVSADFEDYMQGAQSLEQDRLGKSLSEDTIDARLFDWRQQLNEDLQGKLSSLGHRLEAMASSRADRNDEVLCDLEERLQNAEALLRESCLAARDTGSEERCGQLKVLAEELRGQVLRADALDAKLADWRHELGSGQLKLLIEELQSQVLGKDSLEAKLADWRRQLDSDLQQNMSSQTEHLQTLIEDTHAQTLESMLSDLSQELNSDLQQKMSSQNDHLKSFVDLHSQTLDARFSDWRRELDSDLQQNMSLQNDGFKVLVEEMHSQLFDAKFSRCRQDLDCELERKILSQHDKLRGHVEGLQSQTLETRLAVWRQEIDRDLQHNVSLTLDTRFSSWTQDLDRDLQQTISCQAEEWKLLIEESRSQALDVRLLEWREMLYSDLTRDMSSQNDKLKRLIQESQSQALDARLSDWRMELCSDLQQDMSSQNERLNGVIEEWHSLTLEARLSAWRQELDSELQRNKSSESEQFKGLIEDLHSQTLDARLLEWRKELQVLFSELQQDLSSQNEREQGLVEEWCSRTLDERLADWKRDLHIESQQKISSLEQLVQANLLGKAKEASAVAILGCEQQTAETASGLQVMQEKALKNDAKMRELGARLDAVLSSERVESSTGKGCFEQLLTVSEALTVLSHKVDSQGQELTQVRACLGDDGSSSFEKTQQQQSSSRQSDPCLGGLADVVESVMESESKKDLLRDLKSQFDEVAAKVVEHDRYTRVLLCDVLPRVGELCDARDEAQRAITAVEGRVATAEAEVRWLRSEATCQAGLTSGSASCQAWKFGLGGVAKDARRLLTELDSPPAR